MGGQKAKGVLGKEKMSPDGVGGKGVSQGPVSGVGLGPI